MRIVVKGTKKNQKERKFRLRRGCSERKSRHKGEDGDHKRSANQRATAVSLLRPRYNKEKTSLSTHSNLSSSLRKMKEQRERKRRGGPQRMKGSGGRGGVLRNSEGGEKRKERKETRQKGSLGLSNRMITAVSNPRRSNMTRNFRTRIKRGRGPRNREELKRGKGRGRERILGWGGARLQESKEGKAEGSTSRKSEQKRKRGSSKTARLHLQEEKTGDQIRPPGLPGRKISRSSRDGPNDRRESEEKPSGGTPVGFSQEISIGFGNGSQ